MSSAATSCQRKPELADSIRNRFDFSEQLLEAAERELTAFIAAVHQRFGAEQAQRSSEDWLEELMSPERSNRATFPDFRKVTIGAAAKLARHPETKAVITHPGEEQESLLPNP